MPCLYNTMTNLGLKIKSEVPEISLTTSTSHLYLSKHTFSQLPNLFPFSSCYSPKNTKFAALNLNQHYCRRYEKNGYLYVIVAYGDDGLGL